jgi:hypothetical protein
VGRDAKHIVDDIVSTRPKLHCDTSPNLLRLLNARARE